MPGDISGKRQDLVFSLYQERDRYIAVALSYVQDMEKARDIVSDSFAYLLEKLPVLPDDKSRIRAYLMLTVKHKCLDHLKHLAVKENALKNLYETDIEFLGNDNVTERIMERDIEEILSHAGTRMKRMTFDILVSSRLDGLSHKEIAEKYGITRGRVAKEIMHAMKIMKKLFKDYLHVILPILLLAASLPGGAKILFGA